MSVHLIKEWDYVFCRWNSFRRVLVIKSLGFVSPKNYQEHFTLTKAFFFNPLEEGLKFLRENGKKVRLFIQYMLQTICVALLPYCQWNKDYFQHFNMSFIIIYVIWNHITSKGLQWKHKKYLKCTKDRIKMMSRMM